MLTIAQAWREIGKAFEKRAEKGDTEFLAPDNDIAHAGLCRAVTRIGLVSDDDKVAMKERITDEIRDNDTGDDWIVHDWTVSDSYDRAALAYLFAEEV